MTNVFFSKNWSNVKVKVKYQHKDLITRDIHVKYQSSITHYSKVISKIKVQLQGHRVKNNGTQGKVLSQGIPM